MMLFAEGNQPITVICLALLAITVTFVLMRTQKALARQRQARSPEPSREQESAEHHTGPQDFLRWDVKMHETARDLSAQLDSKLGLLQHLVREADRAAARLEAALEASEAASPTTAPPPPRNQADALRGSLHNAELAGLSLEKTPPAANDARYQEIYTLSDYGYPPSEIARRLGSPVGEIELILSLRKQR